MKKYITQDLVQESIKMDDFGFYMTRLNESYTGIKGYIFINVKYSYEDILGYRIRYYPNEIEYIDHINPYCMDPVFFDLCGNIKCYENNDIKHFDKIKQFILLNLNALIMYWDHTEQNESDYDIYNKIEKLVNENK